MQHGPADSLLDCPVCLSQMGCNGSAIWLCVGGHSFCNTCTLQLDKCPLCRSAFSGVKNFHLQEVAVFFELNPTLLALRKTVISVPTIAIAPAPVTTNLVTPPNRRAAFQPVRRRLFDSPDLRSPAPAPAPVCTQESPYYDPFSPSTSPYSNSVYSPVYTHSPTHASNDDDVEMIPVIDVDFYVAHHHK
jgi:hypothetical protein